MGVNAFLSRAGGMWFWAASASLLFCMSCAQSNSPAVPTIPQTRAVQRRHGEPLAPERQSDGRACQKETL